MSGVKYRTYNHIKLHNGHCKSPTRTLKDFLNEVSRMATSGYLFLLCDDLRMEQAWQDIWPRCNVGVALERVFQRRIQELVQLRISASLSRICGRYAFSLSHLYGRRRARSKQSASTVSYRILSSSTDDRRDISTDMYGLLPIKPRYLFGFVLRYTPNA